MLVASPASIPLFLSQQDPKFPKPYSWMGLDAFLVLAPTHLINIMPSTLPCHLFRDGHTIQPKINSINFPASNDWFRDGCMSRSVHSELSSRLAQWWRNTGSWEAILCLCRDQSWNQAGISGGQSSLCGVS